MNFIERVNMLRVEKGVAKSQMLSELSLNPNSFVNWTKRGTIPDGETLIKIANYFEVSVEYLLGKTDIRTSLTQNNHSEEDNSILTMYHQLPEELQEKFRKDLELLSKLSNNQ